MVGTSRTDRYVGFFDSDSLICSAFLKYPLVAPAPSRVSPAPTVVAVDRLSSVLHRSM